MEMPKEAPHQFTEITMNFFSDEVYEDLLKISYFAKINGTSVKYQKLSDALRKYQWFLIAYMRAQAIEDELLKIEVGSHLLMDPMAQSEFSKSVYEMIIYGKATLDSLAQFIAELFGFNMKPQECDFKWVKFRERIEETEVCPGLMGELEYWLSKDSELTNSISSTRDYWIHRDYVMVPLLWPPNNLGCLVIPKLIEKNNIAQTKFTNDYYYSFSQFVGFHKNNLFRIISTIVRNISMVESRGENVSIPEEAIKNKISFFPCGITESKEWDGFLIGPFTSGSNQANSADTKNDAAD